MSNKHLLQSYGIKPDELNAKSYRDLLPALVADGPVVFVAPGNFLYFGFFPLLSFVEAIG